jgi:anhydro-N-acetylmuramic acid kinase
MKSEYNVVGLMSGTSLDGLDVVLASFSCHNSQWSYQVHYGTTIPYPEELGSRIGIAHKPDGLALAELDVAFAGWCGQHVKQICGAMHFRPDVIGSHGHTVFHQPHRGLTWQMGNGSVMAAVSGYPVVHDFRSADVAMGGHGAPLVPVGDHHLFADYRYCLNLGGIANVSTVRKKRRVAWDIVPVNMVLNLLANRLGYPFDPDGGIARSGSVIPHLLEYLEGLPWYAAPPPKSLGREWMELNILPMLAVEAPPTDLLRTCTEHIARQISKEVPGNPGDLILVTGGGTHNRFLTERIQSMTHAEVFIPDQQLIDFKEALVFGFLGLLRLLGQHNVLASVTGAATDHCAGSLSVP